MCGALKSWYHTSAEGYGHLEKDFDKTALQGYSVVAEM